jgi:hypothetical protein
MSKKRREKTEFDACSLDRTSFQLLNKKSSYADWKDNYVEVETVMNEGQWGNIEEENFRSAQITHR